jgi:thymidylate kinase
MLKILIFTGLDKCGKTTLKNEVLKQTNDFICVERFTADQYVYNGMNYKNPGGTTLADCIRIDTLLKDAACYVYLFADRKTIFARMIDNNEQDVQFKMKNFDEVSKKFVEYLSKTPIKVIKVDTGAMNIKESVDYIRREAR